MGSRIVGKRQDRLLAFFDAVLAIAMTVLALEITIPELAHAGAAERYGFFETVTCYLTSFVALSTLWYVHNNFFSSHNLTGKNSEVVLHLVLLFVITLFQPLTKAIGAHPQDLGIRVLYLTDFFVMYGLVALIFVTIRHREDALNQKKRERTSQAMEWQDGQRPGGDDMSEEARELYRLLHLSYAIEHPEEIQRRLAEKIPQDYREELERYSEDRRKSYRLSINSVAIMAVAVTAAVITLMFSAWFSYIALGAGLVAIFLMRRICHLGTDD